MLADIPMWIIAFYGVVFGLVTNITNLFHLASTGLNLGLVVILTSYYTLAPLIGLPQLPLGAYVFALAYFIATFLGKIGRIFFGLPTSI